MSFPKKNFAGQQDKLYKLAQKVINNLSFTLLITK